MKFSNDFSEIMDLYRDIQSFKSNSISIERDFKLRILRDELCPQPNIKKIKRKSLLSNTPYWNTIQMCKGKSIITGSVALYSFGLLSRTPLNLDIIMLEDFQIEGKEVDMQYSVDNINHNLIKTLRQNKLIIHLFSPQKESTITHEGLIFHNPYQILLTKMKIFMNDGPIRHFIDISEYLNKMNISHHQ